MLANFWWACQIPLSNVECTNQHVKWTSGAISLVHNSVWAHLLELHEIHFGNHWDIFKLDKINKIVVSAGSCYFSQTIAHNNIAAHLLKNHSISFGNHKLILEHLKKQKNVYAWFGNVFRENGQVWPGCRSWFQSIAEWTRNVRGQTPKMCDFVFFRIEAARRATSTQLSRWLVHCGAFFKPKSSKSMSNYNDGRSSKLELQQHPHIWDVDQSTVEHFCSLRVLRALGGRL